MSIKNYLEQNKLDLTSSADDSENACVVCFKNVEIYSIGECDHPVCYECSTRMRVLCKQHECPICRQGLEKVIFTYEKLSYRELESKNRTEYFNIKYRIGFYTNTIQKAFNKLLDHPCPKCEHHVFRKFAALREHVLIKHDHYYCDLCTDNLKIFSFERRCYSKTELLLHCRKGDPDNKSHRGHPLCEYCNKRYLDRDELFRHLRREHYFCHFCDAEGFNEFYKNYDSLRNHFRKDHFLCEEGKCGKEEFTGAFRTEIDFKAHVANVHGKSLNKQQVKQTRTLQLEITLGPRGRLGQTEPHIANVCRSKRSNENDVGPQLENSPSCAYLQALHIDARNEQEFPSLGNGTSAPSPLPIPMGMRAKLCSAGLARTKENFPALGSVVSSDGPSTSCSNSRAKQQTSISSIIKKSSFSISPNMLIDVCNRPSTSSGAISKKPYKNDYPALPTTSKAAKQKIREDVIPKCVNNNYYNPSSKYHSLLNDYVSVVNPNNVLKLQLVQKETEAKKNAFEEIVPNLNSTAFPELVTDYKTTVSSITSCTWTKSLKQQREAESRRNKVAPPPFLNSKPKNLKHSDNHNSTNEKYNKKEKKKNNTSTDEMKKRANNVDNKAKKDHYVENKAWNTNSNFINQVFSGNKINSLKIKSNGLYENETQAVDTIPGFSAAVQPPQGYQNVTLNSLAKIPHSLTLINSLGESYNIVPCQNYIQPPEAITRNQKLVTVFKNALETPESLEKFRQISQQFREGTIKAQLYYTHCHVALKDKFDTIFPELLSLLPNIKKQQELYLVYAQKLSDDQNKLNQNLDVCPICKQVLIPSDAESHIKLHSICDNFPPLENSDKKK